MMSYIQAMLPLSDTRAGCMTACTYVSLSNDGSEGFVGEVGGSTLDVQEHAITRAEWFELRDVAGPDHLASVAV